MRPRYVILVSALFCATGAHAQGWSPQRNVELVVGFVAGGGMDRTARSLDRILVSHKLVTSGVTVMNKPGGGSNIAYTYTSQRPADGHTIMIGGGTLLTNHIMGTSKLHYSDFTVIALLFNDYPVFAVNAASPMRNGKDVIERLKADPRSVTTGYAAVGGGNHLSAVLLHKAIGGRTADLKGVSYKGAAEAITSLLGGHIDLTATSAGGVMPHVAVGKLRVVAVAAPRRLGGALAGVPTWKEQGADVVYGLWRLALGPKGMAAAQTAFWEDTLRKATQTPEWKSDMEQNFWSDEFVVGEEFRKTLAQEYATTRALFVDLGLARH
ncbi:MAG TPA: tripartite tricarboxylate transporter substrate binding protein [Burkholderiales bacterium]|nr:tripartite tricarboxylate transporter substrate binding protein [Burkholderiales bacterium]